MSLSIHLDVQGLDSDRCRTVAHGSPVTFATVELVTEGGRLLLYVGHEDIAGARSLAALLTAAADDVEAAWALREPVAP